MLRKPADAAANAGPVTRDPGCRYCRFQTIPASDMEEYVNRHGSSGTVSVIVPVYNVEEYLPRCLESICGQTYEDLQIILVDDGSTDGSLRICRQFAGKDPRILSISIPNSGVSAARNRGLELATGEWIGFIDADDYIEAGLYELLVTELARSDKQIVSCGVRAEDTGGNRIERLRGRRVPADRLDLDREEALLRFLNPDTRVLYWAVWNKLYSAELLRDLRFEEGRVTGEDFDITLRCLLRSNGIRRLPEEMYHYLIRPGSAITRGGFSKSSFDKMFFWDRAVAGIEKAGLSEEVVRCARLGRELTAAKLLRDYYREGTNAEEPEEIDRWLARCREVLSSGREVLRAPLVRKGGLCPWSAVTAKSKALCFTAAHCEKMLRFL